MRDASTLIPLFADTHFEGTTMNDNPLDQAELIRLGIKRVPTESFLWGNYRYSNAHDAIAAARRGEGK